MPLTPAPTSTKYPFLISEVTGGGGDGKTHWACSCVGRPGNLAYFHSSQKRGTMEPFAKWAVENNRRIDWSDFGLMVESTWDDKRIQAAAEAKLQELISDLRKVVASGEYHTAVLDSVSFVKYLAFLAEWGLNPPKTIPKNPNKAPYLDNMKIYGPVNRRIEEIYQLFGAQPWDKPGTSLIMTTEGKCVYEENKPTDVYEAPALGRLEFYCHFRAVLGGPLRGTRANTITYHRGGNFISRLNKPQPREEFPEAIAYLLDLDPADWGRGPDVPPSFAAPECPGCKRQEGLTYKKIDEEWMIAERDGSLHQCG